MHTIRILVLKIKDVCYNIGFHKPDNLTDALASSFINKGLKNYLTDGQQGLKNCLTDRWSTRYTELFDRQTENNV